MMHDAEMGESATITIRDSVRGCSLLVLIAFAMLAVLVSTDAAAGDAEIIELKAKLVEIPSKFPPADLYDYAYVMKYEVLSGELAGKSIFVAHFNPRVARKKVKGEIKKHVAGKLRRFKEGDLHELKLTADIDSIWQDAVVDEYFATDRKSTRYWCLKVDPAK